MRDHFEQRAGGQDARAFGERRLGAFPAGR